jgi:hypothetical protein
MKMREVKMYFSLFLKRLPISILKVRRKKKPVEQLGTEQNAFINNCLK